MATPKTPRKAATKPNQDTKVDAPDVISVEDTVESMAIGSDSADGTVQDAEAKSNPMTREDVTPTDGAEDAVVLSEPTVEETSNPDSHKKTAPQETVTEEKPAPEQPMPSMNPQAPVTVKSGPSFLPLVLGGVVAAGLGFGLARYVVPEGWPVPGMSALQIQLAEQAKDIDTLRAELLALPKGDAANVVLGELGAVRDTAAAALEAAEAAKLATANLPAAISGEDLAPRLAALEDRLKVLEQRPVTAGSVDPAVLSNLTAEIDSLRSGLATQKAAAEALVTEAEAVRADAAAKAQFVLLRAALTKVEASMLDGAPFVEPLTLLVNAGLPVPAILSENAENGLPTLSALIEGFDEPARAALEKSLRGNMGSTWSDRVGSFLRSQTGARSLTPQEGDDPDAVLSRANAALIAGDLQTALTEIATLPEAAQTALADWVGLAKLRFDAQAATVTLATALSER